MKSLVCGVLLTCLTVAALAQTEQWRQLYEGATGGRDLPAGICVDRFGNAYVWSDSFNNNTGARQWELLKYDFNGNLLWMRAYGGGDPGLRSLPYDGIQLDRQGNIFVIGNANGKYTTLKYDPNGVQVWVRQYAGPVTGQSVASALAVDTVGNVIVTGESNGVSSFQDYATVKYDTNGNELWVARYNGPLNSSDTATDVTTDSVGNVYVTGASTGRFQFVTTYDYLTIKYDANGNQLWNARYNDAANRRDYPHRVRVDAGGNVLVVGRSERSNSQDKVLLVKYDQNGSQLWTYTYADHFVANWLPAMELDSAGNILLAMPSPFTGDAVTTKVSTTGLFLWARSYDGPMDPSGESVPDLEVDRFDNVYLFCVSGYVNLPSQAIIVKYDMDGNQQWEHGSLQLPYSGFAPVSVARGAVDRSGNVYAVGSFNLYGAFNTFDLFTIKVSQGQVNEPPVATDDFYGISQGSSLSVAGPGILANDSDGDEDPLTAELVTGPSNAVTFQLNPDGSFSYTPHIWFTGEDSFTYLVSDGTENSDVVTVHITVTQPGAGGFITGGGKYFQDGRKCTFGFVSKVTNGGVQGQFEFQDHESAIDVKSQAMQWVYAPNQVDGYFSGTCTVNGASGYTFFVQVHDRGEPGRDDDFTVWVFDASAFVQYSSGGQLSAAGNIVIHRN